MKSNRNHAHSTKKKIRELAQEIQNYEGFASNEIEKKQSPFQKDWVDFLIKEGIDPNDPWGYDEWYEAGCLKLEGLWEEHVVGYE